LILGASNGTSDIERYPGDESKKKQVKEARKRLKDVLVRFTSPGTFTVQMSIPKTDSSDYDDLIYVDKHDLDTCTISKSSMLALNKTLDAKRLAFNEAILAYGSNSSHSAEIELLHQDMNQALEDVRNNYTLAIHDQNQTNPSNANDATWVRVEFTLFSMLVSASLFAAYNITTFYSAVVLTAGGAIRIALIFNTFMGWMYETTVPDGIIKIVEAVTLMRH